MHIIVTYRLKQDLGHASVYSGTTPKNHGIILNVWYDPQLEKEVNCVEDSKVNTVGSQSENGNYSPNRMMGTTITDQLKMSSQERSKVISVSLKNRGAILPGGHMADGAYWYDISNGKFITSTYYSKELPSWVSDFNNRKLADTYLSGKWETELPIEQYSASTKDDMPFETLFPEASSPTLPIDLSLWENKIKYELLQDTPYGNTILKELALTAIDSEGLGQSGTTDFLAISFSSTDKVGHAFGPQSVEVQDTYIKLDKDLAEIFSMLDSKLGEGNYLLFLTADHGVAEIPAYLSSKEIVSGYYSEDVITTNLNSYLNELHQVKNITEHFSNGQLYVNKTLIKSENLKLGEVMNNIYSFLSELPEVSDVILAEDLRRNGYYSGQRAMVQKGYNWQRSGDITVLYQPTFIEERVGTTHGAGFSYDTHVPLLWYG